MDWLNSRLAAAQQAATQVLQSEALAKHAEKAKELALQAKEQALTLAQEASSKAQVRDDLGRGRYGYSQDRRRGDRDEKRRARRIQRATRRRALRAALCARGAARVGRCGPVVCALKHGTHPCNQNHTGGRQGGDQRGREGPQRAQDGRSGAGRRAERRRRGGGRRPARVRRHAGAAAVCREPHVQHLQVRGACVQ